MLSESFEAGGNLIFAGNDGTMHGIGKRVGDTWKWVSWYYQTGAMTWRIQMIGGGWTAWQPIGVKPELWAGIVNYNGNRIAVVGENQPAGGMSALLDTAIEKLPVSP